MKGTTLACCAAICSGAAFAQDVPEDVAAFVQGNVLGIFYHELGHALIDIEGVPIFGQEEDAADVFSVVMTVAVFDADRVEDLAYDYALGFDAEARLRDDAGDDVAWWDVHGPDEQRFYNTVCLFYGSDPDSMAGYADYMGLPEDRADYCPDEFEQANAAWGGVLDSIIDRGAGNSITYDGPTDGLIGAVLSQEVDALNSELTLTAPLSVTVAACDEANAFYDPEVVGITFCTEFEAHLITAAEETR